MLQSSAVDSRVKASLRGTAILLLLAFGVLTVAATTMAESFMFIYDIPGADKTGHFLLMGALSFAFIAGFRGSHVRGRMLSAAACVVVLLVLITIEETSQIFMEARRFSLGDLAASFSGVLLFAWPAAALSRRADF